jgi:hypothetical protein
MDLWRASERLLEVLYEVPTCVNNGGLYYDLAAGRYVITLPSPDPQGRSANRMIPRRLPM